ncbi:MAG: elongation factor G [Acidobacteriota bacterium]|nr:elongation factor G [Acidobacteriota bacterium]
MKVYKTKDVRNVVLLGHGDSGKTTLTSHLLFTSGTLKRLGKVDDGTAVTDFDDEETHRKISLQTAIAPVEWNQHKINVIDTPGYSSFVADALGGVAVADSAFILVDAVAGPEVITRRTFRFATARTLPIVFVVNKMDRDSASFERTVAAIQDRFGRESIPLQIPLGEEAAFDGAVDLLTMKAHRYEKDGKGTYKEEDIPGELKDAAGTARAVLVEMVAETDDALMEAFFENGELTNEQVREGLAKGLRERTVMPILCSSSLHGVGIQDLLELSVQMMPAPTESRPRKGTDADGKEVDCPISPDDPVKLFVFKTVADPFAGQLSLFRVVSGTLTDGATLLNVRAGQNERIAHVAYSQGKTIEQISELHAGDLGVVAKLKDTQTNDSLCDPAHAIKMKPVAFPEPSISFAVEPKSKGDEEKISTALHRLIDEDPVLRAGRDGKTHELLLSGTDQVHVEVAIAKMKKKFGVDAILKQPKVPYLETIKKRSGQVNGRHKKQSGGRGQFGDCVIEMEPLPRGSGFEFVDKIFGGSIPQNFRPAVQKGIVETAARGWLSGNPMIDFRVTLVDGSYHTVDSSEMAFKIAGSVAFKAAMDKCKPTLLEPVMNVEITIPEDFMGDIMGDLSSRRGKPQGMDADGDYQVIRAQVPMAEMLTYASTRKSITSDRGTYHMEFSHYEEAPSNVREQVMGEYRKSQEAHS